MTYALAGSSTPTLPRISIIIATYNAADPLPGCLDSIAAQTYPHLEVIVGDGASTDGTLDILRDYEGRLNLRWISEPDEGVYDAWNKALAVASGDWICFLGADDRLHHPESLARAAERLADVPAGTLLAYGQVQYTHTNGNVEFPNKPWNEMREDMMTRSRMGHQGCFHSPLLFERVGKFDGSMTYLSDYKLILQSLPCADPVFLGDIVISDQHGGGLTSLRRNRWAMHKERMRIQRELALASVGPRGWLLFAKALLWRVVTRIPGPKNQ